jgi:hypothetical protein
MQALTDSNRQSMVGLPHSAERQRHGLPSRNIETVNPGNPPLEQGASSTFENQLPKRSILTLLAPE